MKYVIANWKGRMPDYKPKDIKIPVGVRVVLCPGHSGELGYEIK